MNRPAKNTVQKTNSPFRMNNLADTYIATLDMLTPHFRPRMYSFPPQQRKIISFLAERQTPANVKTIAQRCFITHQTASGQLRLLLKQNVVIKHQFGRESFYEIEDVQFRHWMDLRAGKIDRIRHYVDFVSAFCIKRSGSPCPKYIEPQSSHSSDSDMLKLFQKFDPNQVHSKSDQELDKLLEFWAVAQSIFG